MSGGFVPTPETFFASTTPGLEAITAQEIQSLGATPEITEGGVSFSGERELLYRANLHLRTASRVLLRVATFEAADFSTLEKQAKRVSWSQWVDESSRVSFRVSCHKSRLYHSGAVKERLEKALQQATRAQISTKNDDDEESHDEQLFLVRFENNQCTISVDTSGALLHQRGYRLATAKAPLRETLAAAMILALRWNLPPAVGPQKTESQTSANPDAPLVRLSPLIDPMCGSGTIPIEAALIARNIPPGLASSNPRRYAFQQWRDYDAARWERVVAQAREKILAKAPASIYAYDQAAGAIDATNTNAERAGVSADLVVARQPISSMANPNQRVLCVSNPPYGHRIGNLQDMRALYQEIGRAARAQLQGSTLALLSSGPHLLSQVGCHFQEVLRTKNGGLSVQLVSAVIPKKRLYR
jgi:putative N6-adenine-specific DNA methylase